MGEQQLNLLYQALCKDFPPCIALQYKCPFLKQCKTDYAPVLNDECKNSFKAWLKENI